MANEFNFVESETVELKSSLSEWQEIIETISAFSNAKGGTIYVGINPKGEVKGVDIGKRTLENLASDIKQYTDPKVFPTMEVGKIGERDVVIIRVREYPTKPVWAKDKVYIRVGRSNQRASAEKIRDFINQNKTFKWDHQLQPALKLSEIDTARVKLFLQKVEEERNTTFEGARATGKILEKLSLLKDGSLTNASLLLFGKNAQEHFLQSEIRCARFNGTEPVDFADMQVINGTLIEQVPAVLNFIRRHINVAAQITGDPERKEIWEYPKEAVREAVVNAICHRSYDDTGNVQVRIFDDRLEVWNPGLLPGNMTIEMLRKHHQSKPRNELIAKCFYLVKYIEQWGTGTNRMIKLCREGGLPGLEFYELADSFIVIFRRKLQNAKKARPKPKQKQASELTATQKKIIEYLEKTGEAGTYELMKFFKLTRRTIQRNMKVLEGIVEWSGESASDPKGRYSMKKKR
jgi:ATP-dependent DNA helicase RecG